MKKLSLIILSILFIVSACKKETSTASKIASTSYLTFTVPTFEFNDIPTAPAVTFSPAFKLAVSSKNKTAPFTYQSSDPTVAKVASDGTVTMLQGGKTINITVSQDAADGFNAASKTIALKIPTASTGTAGVLNPIKYGGGKIFYVDPANGIHGLIAATADQGTYPWALNTVLIANANYLDGSQNPKNIIAIEKNFGSGDYAAKISVNYSVTVNGFIYSDWYLPAKDQLATLYTLRTQIGGFVSTTAYWSSTEQDANHAWNTNFKSGITDFQSNTQTNKTTGYYVRAIRSF